MKEGHFIALYLEVPGRSAGRESLSHLRSSQKFKASAAYFHHLTRPLTPHFLSSPLLEPPVINKLPYVLVALPFPLLLALLKPGISLRSISPQHLKTPFSSHHMYLRAGVGVSILLASIALKKKKAILLSF